MLSFGVAIMTLLLLIQHQLEDNFQRNLKNIDLVVGAKGSPLQLVLSSVYHLDSPTGNIKYAEARKIMENPTVKKAIPLAYGDSYRGYRILGTIADYVDNYEGKIKEGRLFQKNLEATIGAEIASKMGLKIGDQFFGTHGDVKNGHAHEDHPYKVVGILERNNSVLDRIILCNLESVWEVHSHSGHSNPDMEIVEDSHDHEGHDHHDHEGHDHHDHEGYEHHDHEGHNHHDHEGHEHHDHEGHDHHDHEGHDHHENERHDHTAHESKFIADSMDITAVLLSYKSKFSAMQMPRYINSQTKMQAVIPALEINGLTYMIGVGANTINIISAGIMLMAGLSVFFILLNRLRERKYELALMRSLGYRPFQLFSLLIMEGVFFALLAYAFGWLLSRIGIYLINMTAANEFNLNFNWNFVNGEAWIFFITILVGIFASIIPAWRAFRIDVSDTLVNQ